MIKTNTILPDSSMVYSSASTAGNHALQGAVSIEEQSQNLTSEKKLLILNVCSVQFQCFVIKYTVIGIKYIKN